MWVVGLLFLILFEAIADIFSKNYSLKGQASYWVLAISGYIIANCFWLWSIRKGSGLARGGVLFSVGSAILAILIGTIMYGEKIGKVEFAGMIVGVIAVILIFWSEITALI
jgi:drug/metabolite transporter (DMT)-like permease